MASITWTNVRVKLGQLVPWALNPRMSSKKQAARILKSFEDFGQVQTVAIGPAFDVYDGHQRLSALLTLYGKNYEIDARQSDRALTDDERRRLVLALHAGAQGAWNWDALSGWDDSVLIGAGLDADLLKQLSTDAAAVSELLKSVEAGAGASDADAEAQIDKAEELREKWNTARGQVWQLDTHRLMCGDSTSAEDVARLMMGEKAECVFTDPPYGVNIQGGKNNSTIAGDITQTAIPFSFDLACNVATTDDARLYFCGGEGNIGLYSKLFERFCRQLPRHLIWVKNGFVMKPNGYHNQYEIIFHGYKPRGGGLNKWFGGRKEDEASDVWQIKRDASSTYLHPTQKPIEIPTRAIKNSCSPGGIVYEPFSGSGSTLIACEQLGRKCRAMEISPAYVAVALQRWADATGKTPVLIDKVDT